MAHSLRKLFTSTAKYHTLHFNHYDRCNYYNLFNNLCVYYVIDNFFKVDSEGALSGTDQISTLVIGIACFVTQKIKTWNIIPQRLLRELLHQVDLSKRQLGFAPWTSLHHPGGYFSDDYMFTFICSMLLNCRSIKKLCH